MAIRRHYPRKQEPQQAFPTPKIATLVDNFSVNDLSSNFEASAGTISYSTGRVGIQLDTSYSSALATNRLYDLTNSSFYINITPYQNSSVQTSIQFGNSTNGFFFGLSGPNFNVTKVVAGVQTAISNTTYVPSTMGWWRVRESAGTTFWDTSPDGLSWTNQFSTADTTFPGFNMTQTPFIIFCGDFGSDPTGNTYIYSINSPIFNIPTGDVSSNGPFRVGNSQRFHHRGARSQQMQQVFFVPSLSVVAGLPTAVALAATGSSPAQDARPGRALPGLFLPADISGLALTGLAIEITAGLATATGAAPAPAIELRGGSVTSTGASGQPNIELTPGLASGTGSANSPPGIELTAGLPTGTGTAFQPGYALAGGSATSTGASPGPGVELTAGQALGTSTSYGPGVELTAGQALGTGAAFQPGYALNSGSATSTGASPGPGVELTAGQAVGIGSAADWSTGLGIELTPGLANALGVAQDYLNGLTFTSSGNVAFSWPNQPGAYQRWHHRGSRQQQAQQVFPSAGTANAGLAAGVGAAADWSTGLSVELTAGLATGTGTAYGPGADLTPSLATGTGTAFGPGIELTGGQASSTGASQGPGVELTAGQALGTGTAFQPGYALNSGSATSTGASPGPGVELTPALGTGTGTAYGPGIELTPGLAVGVGTAQDYLNGLTYSATFAAIGSVDQGPFRVGNSQRFHHRGARSQQPQAVFANPSESGPPLVLFGFGSFPQVPGNAVIISVIANITQFGSDAQITAPVYQLWDGTNAQIGASQNGTASTTPGNVDSIVFTGVSWSQLATLQLQIFGTSLTGNAGATVSVDSASLSVEWTPNQSASATPGDFLAVVPQFPAATASGVVNATATATLLAVTPVFPAPSAGFEAITVTPGDFLAIVPTFPAVTVSAVQAATATASLLAVVPAFPAPTAGFEAAATTPSTLQVVPVFPPVTASGVVNSTATASLLAITPAFSAPSAGLQNATVTPGDFLAVVPQFPAATASGTISATAIATFLAVVPTFPAIISVTPPGYAATEVDGGWTNPGNALGPPDGSYAVWTAT